MNCSQVSLTYCFALRCSGVYRTSIFVSSIKILNSSCRKLNVALLKFFTRLTAIGARERLALSFRVMKDDDKCHIRVVPPLLRREVLLYESCKGDYVHGYMVNSGFGENIMEWHKKHPDIPLHFFWDKWEEEPVKK